jgi:hypothetical protein
MLKRSKLQGKPYTPNIIEPFIYTFRLLPSSITGVVGQLIAFISYNLNLPIPPIFIKKNHFGSVLLTNVSGFGVDNVYGPICSFTRNIATFVLCSPSLKPVVHENEIKARKMLNVMITFDHRYQDGSGLPKMMNSFMDVWNNP